MSIPNRRGFAEVAESLVAAEQSSSRAVRAAAVMQFFEDFARLAAEHPEPGDALSEAIEEAGGSHVIPILLPMWELDRIPFAVMRQHPVGHGGFHTGVLGRDGPALTWVYDCGALRKPGKTSLGKAIRSFATNRPEGESKRKIDLLFVSHFHSDHVSGLAELMAVTAVSTAVIPYLDELDKLALAVEAIAKGEDVEALLACIADPVRWLRDRGAQRVVVIGQAGPDSSAGLADLRTGPTGLDGGRAEAVLLDPRNRPLVPGPDDESAIVPTGSAWVVRHGPRTAGEWCFLPYVTPASREARERLAVALDAAIGAPGPNDTRMERLVQVLADKKARRKIAACYLDDELGDANAVSMSLYVGPYRDAFLTARITLRADYRSARRQNVGWLLTGDSKLRHRWHRNQWVRFFKPFRSRIGTLMLPHHASPYNFHEAILEVVGEDTLLFACARERTGSDDPFHEEVMSWIGAHSAHLVGDSPDSGLMQISGSTELEGAFECLQRALERWR